MLADIGAFYPFDPGRWPRELSDARSCSALPLRRSTAVRIIDPLARERFGRHDEGQVLRVHFIAEITEFRERLVPVQLLCRPVEQGDVGFVRADRVVTGALTKCATTITVVGQRRLG